MAIMATLTQGLALPEARRWPNRSSRRRIRPARWTRRSRRYRRPARAEREGRVAPILPDIIGEAAILSWLGAGGDLEQKGLAAPPRIGVAARIALAKVSATLVRAAQDFAAAGRVEPIRGWRL